MNKLLTASVLISLILPQWTHTDAISVCLLSSIEGYQAIAFPMYLQPQRYWVKTAELAKCHIPGTVVLKIQTWIFEIWMLNITTSFSNYLQIISSCFMLIYEVPIGKKELLKVIARAMFQLALLLITYGRFLWFSKWRWQPQRLIKVVERKGPDGSILHLSLLRLPPPNLKRE